MNYYNFETTYPRGVVLCVPGLFCSPETYDPMWDTLGKAGLSNTLKLRSEVLSIESILNADLKETIIENHLNYSGLNFYKVMFSDPIDRVDNQAKELYDVINFIKKTYEENINIYLVGYSKGGLVNMRFITLYPFVKIKSVVSIGTPYHTSFLRVAYSLLDDIAKVPTLIENKEIKELTTKLYDFLDNKIIDEDLGSISFYNKLKSEWEKVSYENRPPITLIGCSQFGFDSNSYNGSDLIVSVEDQLANDFKNIDYREVVDDCYIFVPEFEWYDHLYHWTAGLLEQLHDVLVGLTKWLIEGNIGYALLGFVLALIPYNSSFDSCDLFHTIELQNKEVCYKMLEALDRGKKPNKNTNNGGYTNGKY